mgnify:CR=1 FL=1
MNFPFWIEIGTISIHPHLFFEILGYLFGISATVFASSAGKDTVEQEERYFLIVAGFTGALIGAKILAWAQHPQTTMVGFTDEPTILFGGKTIVGGLLGGMTSIELCKQYLGIEQRTGDPLIIPLSIGITFGRIGCFLTGLDDGTYGSATSLPWGVDFGDSIYRHPTQIYEIVFIWSLFLCINFWTKNNPVPSGWKFRTYLMGYLFWRLIVDSIKPADWEIMYLSPIQIACIVGLIWYLTRGIITEEEYHSAGK